VLGRGYGDATSRTNVRLACHGLDVNDNDFVIGLAAASCTPLSHLVQAMRRPSRPRVLATLAAFFVGHALWQAPLR